MWDAIGRRAHFWAALLRLAPGIVYRPRGGTMRHSPPMHGNGAVNAPRISNTPRIGRDWAVGAFLGRPAAACARNRVPAANAEVASADVRMERAREASATHATAWAASSRLHARKVRWEAALKLRIGLGRVRRHNK